MQGKNNVENSNSAFYICEDGRVWDDRTERRNIPSGCDGNLWRGEKTKKTGSAVDVRQY